jgi:hypothetical protein
LHATLPVSPLPSSSLTSGHPFTATSRPLVLWHGIRNATQPHREHSELDLSRVRSTEFERGKLVRRIIDNAIRKEGAGRNGCSSSSFDESKQLRSTRANGRMRANPSPAQARTRRNSITLKALRQITSAPQGSLLVLRIVEDRRRNGMPYPMVECATRSSPGSHRKSL